MHKTILKIQGMSCGHCEKHVTEALQNLAGVAEAKADHKTGTAEAIHAEDISEAAFRQAIDEAGYELCSQ